MTASSEIRTAPGQGAVSVTMEDGIAWIGIDDGKVNAMSAALIGEIDRALDAAEAAGAVTVLTGRPGIFSAGFDLGTFKRGPEAGIEMVRAGAELVLRLLEHPRPVLTVCTGHAYPMGAFLMLSADTRLAAAGDWKIGMNETAIGLTVPLFAVELARHKLTAPGFARVTSGALFGPEEAMRLGYVDRVVEPGELERVAREEARRLAGLDIPSYEGTKARVNGRAVAAIRAGVEGELGAQVE